MIRNRNEVKCMYFTDESPQFVVWLLMKRLHWGFATSSLEERASKAMETISRNRKGHA